MGAQATSAWTTLLNARVRTAVPARCSAMALPMKKAGMKKVAGMKKRMKSGGMKRSMKKAMKKKSTKKAMTVSKIAKGKLARSLVFFGRKEKTTSGLKKNELVRSKSGKVV